MLFRSVRVEDRSGVAVYTRGLLLEHRNDQDYAELLRDLLHVLDRGSGNRLSDIEALALLRFAEVRGIEQFLQADDLRSTASRFTHSLGSSLDICGCIGGYSFLDKSDFYD